jgi:hypothetical protein
MDPLFTTLPELLAPFRAVLRAARPVGTARAVTFVHTGSGLSIRSVVFDMIGSTTASGFAVIVLARQTGVLGLRNTTDGLRMVGIRTRDQVRCEPLSVCGFTFWSVVSCEGTDSLIAAGTCWDSLST